jgi:hypothetical protein
VTPLHADDVDSAPDRLRSLPLTAASGYESFGVVGSVAGKPVRADWDGSSLRLDQSLFDRAVLGVAVDDAIAETALDSPRHRSTVTGPIPDVVLTLARSCDVVDAAEYRYRGHRRTFLALAPDAVLVVGTTDLRDDPTLPPCLR